MRKLIFLLVLIASIFMPTPANAKATNYIVTAGDSLVVGVGAPPGYSWPERMQGYCGSTCFVASVGHSGSCLVFTGCGYGPTLLQTFDSEVLARHPTKVIIAPGRNDLCHVSTDLMIDSILRLRGRARNAGVQFYVGTITPAGAGWPWPCESQRIEYNNRLRQMPNTIDFEKLVINDRGLLRWVYDSGDGLHLNADGYLQLAYAACSAVC